MVCAQESKSTLLYVYQRLMSGTLPLKRVGGDGGSQRPYRHIPAAVTRHCYCCPMIEKGSVRRCFMEKREGRGVGL